MLGHALFVDESDKFNALLDEFLTNLKKFEEVIPYKRPTSACKSLHDKWRSRFTRCVLSSGPSQSCRLRRFYIYALGC